MEYNNYMTKQEHRQRIDALITAVETSLELARSQGPQKLPEVLRLEALKADLHAERYQYLTSLKDPEARFHGRRVSPYRLSA